MPRADSPTIFKREFCRRLKLAREFKGFTQEDFAKRLNLLPNTYSKYEKRTPLPHYLVPLACSLLEIKTEYLYGLDAKISKQA